MTAPSESSETPLRSVALKDGDALESFHDRHDLALVEFYTDGCPTCAAMEPVLSGVARDPDLAVGTLNPRKDPVLVDSFDGSLASLAPRLAVRLPSLRSGNPFDVRSVPLLVLFRDGSVAARLAEGFVGVDEIDEWVDAVRPR